MSVRGWVIAAGIAGLISGMAAGIGTYMASPAASAWAWGLYDGFLAASFIAVLWYALTAHEQVRVSREIFEAAHRPSFEVIFEPAQTSFYQNPNNYTFPFHLYNHGSVPAVLVGWRGTVRRGDVVEVEGPLRDAGLAIFPARQAQLNFANVRGPQVPTPPDVEVEITVKYHSPSVLGVVYTTRMVASPADNWRGRFPEIT